MFNFPDDEKLIQQEFAKNVPFALSVAETAAHPDRPASSVGLKAADFTPAAFPVSYSRGADQEVAVVARKAIRDKELKYRVNGGRTLDQALRPWKGGQVYGGEDNLYFDEYRAAVQDGEPGDKVEVWFTGETRSGRKVSSERFTYTVAKRPKADTLVVAEEGTAATQARTYVDALKAAGHRRSSGTWPPRGAPRRAGRAEALPDGRALLRRERPGQRHPAPAARLPQRGRQADRGRRAGRRQRRPRRRHPVGRLQPVLPGRLQPYVDQGGHRLHRLRRAQRLHRRPRATRPATRSTRPAPTASPPTSCRPGPSRSSRARARGTFAGTVNPYGPYTGSAMAAAVHTDDAYKRLTRTIDLTGGARPTSRSSAPACCGDTGGRLRPRGGRGAHRGRRRLDHPAGDRRGHEGGRAAGLRGRVPDR